MLATGASMGSGGARFSPAAVAEVATARVVTRSSIVVSSNVDEVIEGALSNFTFAPGYKQGLANHAMRRDFIWEVRRLGFVVDIVEKGGSYVRGFVVRINKLTAKPGTLMDEFLHAWNRARGRGKFLPSDLATKHKQLEALVKRLGRTDLLGNELNMLYHQLEFKNFLMSGERMPGFMKSIPIAELKQFLEEIAGDIYVGFRNTKP